MEPSRERPVVSRPMRPPMRPTPRPVTGRPGGVVSSSDVPPAVRAPVSSGLRGVPPDTPSRGPCGHRRAPCRPGPTGERVRDSSAQVGRRPTFVRPPTADVARRIVSDDVKVGASTVTGPGDHNGVDEGETGPQIYPDHRPSRVGSRVQVRDTSDSFPL